MNFFVNVRRIFFYQLFVCIVFLASVITAFFVNDKFVWVVALHPVLFLLTIGPVVKDYIKLGFWFNIVNFVLVLSYIYFGLGSLFYISYYDSLPHETLKNPDYATITFLLVCIGVLFYKLGSITPISNLLARVLPTKSHTPCFSSRIRFGVLLSFAITIIIKLYLINSGYSGFFSDTSSTPLNKYLTLLNLVGVVGLLGVMIGFYYWFSGAPLTDFDKIVLTLFTLILVLFALMSGMKAKLLYVALLIVMPAIFVGRRQEKRIIPLKFYAVLVSLFLAYWVVNPILRSAMVDNQSDNISQAVEGLFEDGIELSNINMKNSVHTLWERVSLFRYFNSVVAQTGVPGGVDYRGWDRYPYLLISFIPRLIMPDKPINNYSAQFNLDYISNVFNSTTPSVFGWAYMESGIFSLILLMFVLGIVHATVDRYCLTYGKGSVFSITVFFIFFHKFANIEPDIYWILSGIYQEIVLIIFCYLLFFAKYKFK